MAARREATGSPMLEGTLGYVDCTIHAVHEAGDHYVVDRPGPGPRAPTTREDPLLFFQGQYTSTDG